MVTFKEFLNEMFNTSYPINKEKSMGDVLHNYSFKSPNDKYLVTVGHYPESKGKAYLDFQSSKGGMGTSDAEGKDSHKVFGTVLNTLHKHLTDNPHIDKVHFSGVKDTSTGNRTNLYNNIMKRYGGKPTSDNENSTEYEIDANQFKKKFNAS